MGVFRQPPAPSQQALRGVALFGPGPVAQDPPLSAPFSQQLALAAYRPAFVRPQASIWTSVLFPAVVAQDSVPPPNPAQALALAAYRPQGRNPVFLAPGAAILDYYEADASMGQDTVQALAWAAYRPAVVMPQFKILNTSALFPPAAGGGFFARYYYEMTGIQNV